MSARIVVGLLLVGVFASGCLGSDEPAKVEQVPQLPGGNVTLPKVVWHNGTVTVSAAAPGRTFSQTAAAAPAITKDANSTGFIVEVKWKANNQLTDKMSLWVRQQGAGALGPGNANNLVTPPANVAQADGMSPLRIVLNASKVPANGAYEVLLRASAAPVGVAYEQGFSMALVTFRDMAFNETLSVMPR